jgi:phenylacetate-CoA ligase
MKKDTTQCKAAVRVLDNKLIDVVRHAYEKAPTYKERLNKAGISPKSVRSISDLEKLPVLRKDNLIELCRERPPFGGLLTIPAEQLERIYVSPGPIYDPHHQDISFWRRHARIYRAMGFRRGDIVINTWAYHVVPAGLMFDKGLRMAGATVIPLGTGKTEQQIQVMRDIKATAFYGTTGFFMTIITKAEEMGLDIRKDFNLRLACIGGEMGGGPIRTFVEEKYGIMTRDAYGTSDVGVVAYECRCKSGLHIDRDVIVEICDPANGRPVREGKVGEVVVTTIEKSSPFIRFGTGDLAMMTTERCACGSSLPRLSRVLGRVGDAVRTRGMFIHPRQLQPALAPFGEIAKYQAAVSRQGYRDILTLRIELGKDFNGDHVALKTRLADAVKKAVSIKVDVVDFVSDGTITEAQKIIVDERIY